MIQENGLSSAPVHGIVHQPLPLDRIICGDNCEVMRTLPSESIDLVVTSPPYDDLRTYGGHGWDFYGVAWNLKRLLKPGGVIVWVVNDKTENGNESATALQQALHFKSIGLCLLDTMIWNKPPAGANGSSLCYPQSSEYMFILAKGKPKSVNRLRDRKNATAGQWQRKTVGGRCGKNNEDAKDLQPTVVTPEFGLRTNVWEYAVGSCSGSDSTDHPAVFPEALARDHILSWSNEGDIVLDPFSGSGTTAKMAKHNGRRYIGIEVNPEYVEIAEKRMMQQVLF